MKKEKESLTPEQKKKRRRKIVVRVIVIFVAFFLVSNAIATKIIYDSIFKRYDGETKFDIKEYSELVDTRTCLSIAEDDETLQGYFYDVAEEKGIVVIAPGLHAGANDYLPITGYLLEDGWDVLSFDPLGCNASTGKSTVGFSQEIEDLDTVVTYVENNYPGEDIVLLGHSRGGFAVCSMLETDHDIKAVVSISGHNPAMEAGIGLSERYIGKVANANYFNLWAYQVMLFGADTMDIEADDCISASNIPVFIIQGSEDTTAPADEYSIYSHNDEIASEAAKYLLNSEEGSNGHTDIMFDDDGVNDALMEEITAFLDEAVKE